MKYQSILQPIGLAVMMVELSWAESLGSNLNADTPAIAVAEKTFDPSNPEEVIHRFRQNLDSLSKNANGQGKDGKEEQKKLILDPEGEKKEPKEEKKEAGSNINAVVDHIKDSMKAVDEYNDVVQKGFDNMDKILSKQEKSNEG